MLRQIPIALLAFIALPAFSVPLVFNDGASHVISGTADGVTAYNGSSVTMTHTATVNGDVYLGRDPAPAPYGSGSSATFTGLGGRVVGNVTTSTVPLSGFDPPLANRLDVTLVGNTEIQGDITLGARDFDATFADNVKVSGDVVLYRAGISSSDQSTVLVSGGTFGGGFQTLTSGPGGFDRITISDGHFQGGTFLGDIDDLLITGGTHDGDMIVSFASSASSVTITGGQFNRGIYMNQVTGSVEIFGGNFSGLVLRNLDGVASIYGGVFDGRIGVSGGDGDVNIYGGLFTENSSWLDDLYTGSINVYGWGLTWDGSFLNGYLSDGSYLSTALAGTFNLNLYNTPVANVPEPTTLSLLGAGLFGIGFLRRRRSL